jgi:hypothetical protein
MIVVDTWIAAAPLDEIIRVTSGSRLSPSNQHHSPLTPSQLFWIWKFNEKSKVLALPFMPPGRVSSDRLRSIGKKWRHRSTGDPGVGKAKPGGQFQREQQGPAE